MEKRINDDIEKAGENTSGNELKNMMKVHMKIMKRMIIIIKVYGIKQAPKSLVCNIG